MLKKGVVSHQFVIKGNTNYRLYWQSTMRIPIRATRFPVMSRFIFIGLSFGLLYIFSVAMVNFNTNAADKSRAMEQQPAPILLPVTDSATEELPLSYNLMEETHGKRWTKTPGKYLSSINCTVGKYTHISIYFMLSDAFHCRLRVRQSE